VSGTRSIGQVCLVLFLAGCFGGGEPEPPPPPPPVNMGPARAPGTRPKECQVAMQLITTCKVALEPTRISAVAECTNPAYLGDTELQIFLRCLGEAPTCEQLQRCSGPVGTLTPATPLPPAGDFPTPTDAPPAPPADAPPVPDAAPPSPPTGSG
jgi:hypothetical protein